MNIVGALKDKALYLFAGPVFEAIEQGKHGQFLQRAYIATKGYKTVIGLALVLFFTALTEYAPPYAKTATRALDIAALVLLAGGLIDKAYRKEALFPAWFLEALARVTNALTWFQGFLAIAVDPLLELVAPGCVKCDSLHETLELWLAAGFAATALVNRLARANAAAPPAPTTAGGAVPATG